MSLGPLLATGVGDLQACLGCFANSSNLSGKRYTPRAGAFDFCRLQHQSAFALYGNPKGVESKGGGGGSCHKGVPPLDAV